MLLMPALGPWAGVIPGYYSRFTVGRQFPRWLTFPFHCWCSLPIGLSSSRFTVGDELPALVDIPVSLVGVAQHGAHTAQLVLTPRPRAA